MLILSCLIANHHDFSQGKEFYVTNSANATQQSSCWFENQTFYPCLTLEKLAEIFTPLPFLENDSFIILTFLQKKFSIYNNISLYFSGLYFVDMKPFMGETTLDCIGDLSLKYSSVSIIIIESIKFYQCGKSIPVIAVKSFNKLSKVFILNTDFLESGHGFLKINQNQTFLNMTNCLFDGNKDGYAVDFTSLSLTSFVINATFSNNIGSMRISSATTIVKLVFENCLFINNTSGNTSMGGAVALYHIAGTYQPRTNGKNLPIGNLLLMYNCTFINNSAKSGGALVIKSSLNFTAFDCKFLGNRASEEGGAITFEYINRNVYDAYFFRFLMAGCTFHENYASIGGSIYIQSAKQTMRYEPIIHTIYILIAYSTFSDNSAKWKGGALAIISYGIIRKGGDTGSNLEEDILVNEYMVYIYDSVFYTNSGTSGGAVYIEGVTGARIKNCIFDNNHNWEKFGIDRQGGAVLVTNTRNIVVLDCEFIRNSAANGGALFMDATYTSVLINNTKFTKNTVTNCGGALFIQSYNNLTLCAVIFWANEAAKEGGAIFVNDGWSLVGHCTFTENKAHIGAAIYSQRSHIVVRNIYVQSNLAQNGGGGIGLLNSQLQLFDANHFTNNHVMSGKGGAIYVEDKKEDCSINLCLLLWNNESRLYFSNNSAQVGSIIYGGMIDRCYRIYSEILQFETIKWSDLNESGTRPIASDAVRFCYFDDSIPNCNLRMINRTLYAGQTFSVHVGCLDQVQHAEQCVVRSEYAETATFELGEGENARTINGSDTLKFHAYSQWFESGTLVITGAILCEDNALLIHINIKNCPLGFEKKDGRCQCDNRLKDKITNIVCDIENNSILVESLGWFSYCDNNLRVHKNCPFNYCSQDNDVVHTSSPPSTPCSNNRDGILCGGCIANYSVVLGSWKCMECLRSSSYNFIWLTILLALAGVALIVFLLVVKMTVSTGTMNGLIFYANVLSFSGLLDYHVCSIHPILRIFLSWINLDLGIEICYYSGMDVYQKTWLQFAFPFYIWFLVGIIILFCQYSSKVMKLMGTKNIDILATLFLLSYAKFLKTILSSLSFTDILVASADNVSDPLVSQRVWLHDGNINFLGHKHAPLFAVALFFLVFFFMPYTLLLTFGQCLRYLPRRKGLNWIHSTAVISILDAYHAPYTGHHRYWTGLGLLIRCILFTIFGSSYNINSNLFWIILAVIFIFTIRQCFFSVIYQKKFTNLLELLHLANLGSLSAAIQYSNLCYPLTISATLSLVLFASTMIYHMDLLIKANYSPYNQLRVKIFTCIFKKKMKANAAAEENVVEVRTPEYHSTAFIELREPLITQ